MACPLVAHHRSRPAGRAPVLRRRVLGNNASLRAAQHQDPKPWGPAAQLAPAAELAHSDSAPAAIPSLPRGGRPARCQSHLESRPAFQTGARLLRPSAGSGLHGGCASSQAGTGHAGPVRCTAPAGTGLEAAGAAVGLEMPSQGVEAVGAAAAGTGHRQAPESAHPVAGLDRPGPARPAGSAAEPEAAGDLELAAVDVGEQQRMLSHIQAAARMQAAGCKPAATKQTSLRSLFLGGQRRNSV